MPGQALWGSVVGESRWPRRRPRPGDPVHHSYGWREFALAPGSVVRRIDPDALPTLAAHLSQGATARGALRRAAEVRPGGTVFVTGAARGVGRSGGRIARRLGARRGVGDTGSERKAVRLRAEPGYDDIVVRGAGPVARRLRRAAPDGIDVLLDAVGGERLAAAR
ncbi:hypothetical protein [Streptomyces sp. NPDC048638]|uniref:hypothetical protein n=1 Tax=Streptomyces sp. NPDC048638 TaxID=3365580 RepID=UPI0037110314